MIYFVSDVHLGQKQRSEDRLRESRFLSFLGRLQRDAKHLFIVGDLFDYWFEYKTVIPKYFTRTLSRLGDLRENGLPIDYIIGNHDFGHKNYFRDELGINIHWDDIEITAMGKKFWLSHGDGKSYNDGGYRILKKILRNPLSNKLYRYLHPDFGIGLASGSSKQSRAYTDKKSYGDKDGMIDFAKEKIDGGFDYVVMGHLHKAMKVPINKGFYINLGKFYGYPTFGCFDGENFTIAKADDFIDKGEIIPAI